jgi:hypothetical protein
MLDKWEKVVLIVLCLINYENDMDGTNSNTDQILSDDFIELKNENKKARVKANVEKRKRNPFLAQLTIETKKKRANSEVSTIPLFNDDGDLVSTEINRMEYVDKEEFIKVFRRWLPIFYNFTLPGFKVWSLFAGELGQGQDEIRMHYEDAKRKIASNFKGEAVCVSSSVFYRGINDLIALKIIERQTEKGRQHFFWVNPSAFFNGDRVKFAVTYEKKRSGVHLEEGESPKVIRPLAKKSQASNFSSKRDSFLCATEEEALEAGLADMKEAN